ncbi:MAG: addiction module protein [Pirellulaceae bacterium]|nr:addiction module protein [Pirellulaceae bacterium]
MTLETMIDRLTRNEQLIAMELLWKKLTQAEGTAEPPGWHRDVVAERVAAVENGSDALTDWADAKKRLAKRLQ